MARGFEIGGKCVIGTSLSLILAACSSDAPQSPTSSYTNSNTVSVSQPAPLAENAPAANVPKQAERVMTKIEKMRADAANSSTKGPKPTPRKGPEDSLIYTELTDKARELRIWSKHPQLQKVLKEHDSGTGGTIKIYLRDGRIFDRPGRDIIYLDQISADAVLQLVGVTPNTRQRPSSPTSKGKRSG